jgi:hypothetical protein
MRVKTNHFNAQDFANSEAMALIDQKSNAIGNFYKESTKNVMTDTNDLITKKYFEDAGQ